ATCARTGGWCRRDPRRHQRVQLRGLARQLLPGGSAGQEDAGVLRGAFRYRRDQLLLLSQAHPENRGELGGAGSRAFPLRLEGLATPPARTAAFGYFRLRRLDYDEASLRKWADRVRAPGFEEAFVYFKHEDEARGPAFANQFLPLLDSG